MASKLRSLRRLSTLLKPHSSCPSASYSSKFHQKNSLLVQVSRALYYCSKTPNPHNPFAFSRSFCSPTSVLDSESQGPAAIDYQFALQHFYLLTEDEFHKLADSMIHDLQEKFEEYGDSIQIDGFDIDYGNEVLTLKLGDLGTYVLNKQTPNRQLWLSSPVSGPSRFDWDKNVEGWIYKRTKANLLEVFENELEQLCGESIKLV